MATVDNIDHILGAAIDIRRGFKRFVDVPAADRPAVAQAMAKLGAGAKLQEMLGARTRYSDGGTRR